MPPLSGFWPKLLLVQATIGEGRFGLTAAVLIAGLLMLLAVARLWSEAIWDAHPAGPTAIAARLPLAMAAPIVVLAVGIVGLGIAAGPMIALATRIAADLLAPMGYVAAVLGVAT